MKDLKVINKETGEVVDLDSLDGKSLAKQIETASKQEIDAMYVKYSMLNKVVGKAVSLVKTRIKNDVKDTLDAGDRVMYEHIPVQNIMTQRFDEKALLNSGDLDDLQMWDYLKKKYTRITSTIKIG